MIPKRCCDSTDLRCPDCGGCPGHCECIVTPRADLMERYGVPLGMGAGAH